MDEKQGELLDLHPDARILAYTMQAESVYGRRALRAGAQGYIASELNLSVKTVGTYRERLTNKLGLATARELKCARVAGAWCRSQPACSPPTPPNIDAKAPEMRARFSRRWSIETPRPRAPASA